MDNKNKKEVVKETASQFAVTEAFIFGGKTYLPGDKQNVPQDAREAFAAMSRRVSESQKASKKSENK